MIGRALVVAGLVGVASGCRDFDDPRLGECGNGILEPDEGCDDSADASCGTPGTFAACRLLCEPEDDEACAEGQLCGGDGVCRTPAGAFALEATRIEEEGAVWLRPVDLDGDGRSEILGTFEEPDFKLITHDAVVIDFAEPYSARSAIGDLDGDEREDVLTVPDLPGAGSTPLTLWLGSPDQAIRWARMSTLRTDGAVGRLVVPTAEPGRVLELVDATTTRRWSADATTAVDVAPMGVAAADLGRAIAIADLDGGTCAGPLQAPRPEVAFASAGADRVRVVSTCGDDEPLEDVSEVALAGGVVTSGAGTFFADADGDAHLDLLVQADDGRVFVAWGRADGSFDSGAGPIEGPGDASFAADAWVSLGEATLLAAGDLDGDGTAELVTSTGFIADPSTCADPCEGVPWPQPADEAVIADPNGDGRPDVVTLDDDLIWVHLASAEGIVPLRSQYAELNGPIRELTVGDFNRDTVDDIAVVELDEDANSEADEQVAVLFGGPVTDWRLAWYGPFVHVQSLAVSEGVQIVARTLDAQGRAAGAFIRPDHGEHDVGVALHTPVVARVETGPVVASLGRVSGGPPRLVNLGFIGSSLSPHAIVAGDAIALDEPSHAAAVAVDLDGDERHELALIGNEGGQGRVWTARYDAATEQWRVMQVVAWPEGSFAAPGVDPEFRESDPPPGGGPGSVVVASDVDADGDADVLVTTDAVLPQLIVFRNDGGTLAAGRSLFSVAQPGFEIAFVSPWHDFQGQPHWLVAGEDGVGLATIDLDAGEVSIEQRFEVEIVALAAADLTGDGLLDLVLATDEEVRVHAALESVGAR